MKGEKKKKAVDTEVVLGASLITLNRFPLLFALAPVDYFGILDAERAVRYINFF